MSYSAGRRLHPSAYAFARLAENRSSRSTYYSGMRTSDHLIPSSSLSAHLTLRTFVDDRR